MARLQLTARYCLMLFCRSDAHCHGRQSAVNIGGNSYVLDRGTGSAKRLPRTAGEMEGTPQYI
jgi:hypothetical protein